jgi:hypothetical protein
MIYKFLKPPNFFKGILSNYRGTYKQMFVPENAKEEYCYVELTEPQSIDFKKHFGNELNVVADINEYPGSIASMKNHRIDNFIRVESPGNFR